MGGAALHRLPASREPYELLGERVSRMGPRSRRLGDILESVQLNTLSTND